MGEQPKRKVVTIDGANATLHLEESPVKNLGVSTGAELLHLVNILDPKYRPENFQKADGTPLRRPASGRSKLFFPRPGNTTGANDPLSASCGSRKSLFKRRQD